MQIIQNVPADFIDNIKHGVEITNSLAQTVWPKSTKDTTSAQIDDLINKWLRPHGTIAMVKERLVSPKSYPPPLHWPPFSVTPQAPPHSSHNKLIKTPTRAPP